MGNTISDFEKLDVSPKEAKLLKEEFDTLLHFSNAGVYDIMDVIDVDKQRAHQILDKGKKEAVNSASGFTKPDNYEEHKKEAENELADFEELGKQFPREIRKDLNNFVSFMGESNLSGQTRRNYRNALRRFYYYSLQKFDRREKISMKNKDEIKQVKSQLENFVVSKNNELGTKKYMEFYFDDEDKINKMKNFIGSIEYSNETKLDIEIPWA